MTLIGVAKFQSQHGWLVIESQGLRVKSFSKNKSGHFDQIGMDAEWAKTTDTLPSPFIMIGSQLSGLPFWVGTSAFIFTAVEAKAFWQ